ncbi:MAG: YcaO-like family protein, partial [Hyphomicrobiales bacterium]|nr:YcaO-like family protein [Hyphomicrobiales bacterium]
MAGKSTGAAQKVVQIRRPGRAGLSPGPLDADRRLPPEETIARAKRFAAAFGITRVANLTGLDRTGIPVVMVCRPNARSSAVFNGKGVDVAAAQASALMEATETWHAENIGLPLRFASFADLKRELPVIDIDGLPRTPTPQFDPYLPILWVEGRNLMDNGAIWLPFEIVHADSRMSGPPLSGCFAMSTNGLASGNHFSEAVSHALCEVIERDATTLWHRSPPAEQDARRLDLATVDDPTSLAILNLLARAELNVGVWDITTDVGVSAFQCLLVDRAGDVGHIGVGAACHPARATALRRAVLEAAQVRTTYIIGSREDIEPADYDPAIMARRNADARALMRPPDRVRSFQSAA